MKVDEESGRLLYQSQIRQQLSMIHRRQFAHGFQFNDDAVFDEQVESEARAHDSSFEFDGYWEFGLNAEPFLLQHVLEADPVGAFEETGAQMLCGREAPP